jgi:arginine decarboxylase
MNIQQIQEARELHAIEEWGAGYFGINDQGYVVCNPTGDESRSISLQSVMYEVKKRGISTPLIMRFPQIIESQLERMHTAFSNSISEYNFNGKQMGVFPFKVNQRREFIDAIVKSGDCYDYGLEVGSKTELAAAISYPTSDKALLIVNGFKDEEIIDMTFIAKSMGKNVIVVIEGPDELQTLIKLTKSDRWNRESCPQIGLRMRLYSKGAGKWVKSSGESSKFGLTTNEALYSLKLLKESGLDDKFNMLHFHIGSQITEIKRFKNAIKEASRVYSKVIKMGFSPEYLNIGGGVGVDYDGSKTSFSSSANYTLQEFANDAVYVLGEVCNDEKVPHPTIITESGRIIAAYHSVIVTDIREVQGEEKFDDNSEISKIDQDDPKTHKSIRELKYVLDNINRKNYQEFYHDALEYHEELFTLFNLGYISLEARANAEQLYRLICRKALYYSSFQRHIPEEFESLQAAMVNKYLANFSMFQSIPDAWSIDQLFPVMPLSRHDEKPSEKGTIVDITCDSDGCLDRFIDRHEVKNALDLHLPSSEAYYIGFFLTGAYQESLANEHNLFGAINEAEMRITPKGTWDIEKITHGDPIDELLECRNYNIDEMIGSYKLQFDSRLSEGSISKSTADDGFDRLKNYIRQYPYLSENTRGSNA